MNRVLFTVVVVGALFTTGCKPATDLNRPCSLVRKNPDGGAPLKLTEDDVRSKTGNNKDFIAFGTVECEDLVCVRDATLVTDAGGSDSAMGYCSRPCPQNSQCPSYDEALDEGPTALRCRALLLDAETLAAIAGDGGSFGGVRDPYFCARGGPRDAGQ